MKKLLLLLVLAFIVGFHPAVNFTGKPWRNQDFTTYTETDPNTLVTVTATQVSWNDITRDEDTYVYKDFGAGHFSGDFVHRFEVQGSGQVGNVQFAFWSLTNEVEDTNNLTGDAIYFSWYGDATNYLSLKLIENGGQAWSQDWSSAVDSTTYYITIVRDDDAGANSTGQITAYIRTGSHNGTLQTTLQGDCSAGEQNDFRYLFGLQSHDTNHAAITGDGFTQNMIIQ